MTNPASPVRISHTTPLSLRPATITKVEWRPPYLVYLELGSDLQAVGQLLQELMIGANLTQQEVADLPLFGVRGIDGNGDGDFTDADEGDRLPEPNPSAEFFGKVGACLIDDTVRHPRLRLRARLLRARAHRRQAAPARRRSRCGRSARVAVEEFEVSRSTARRAR